MNTVLDQRSAPEVNDRRAAEGTDTEAWPVPMPLVACVTPEPYPVDALPCAIRAAVEEVQQFTQAPVALVASSALAAVSLAIQSRVDVQRAAKLTGPVGLYLLTVADSGERKSTCEGFFTTAIRAWQAQQAESAKPLLMEHRAALDAWESKRAGLKEKIRQLAKNGKSTAVHDDALLELERSKPQPPRIPKLIYADATPEALKWGLSAQWPSAAVLSSEAGVVLGSHGMGKDSLMRNLSTLNQLWDGTPIYTERRTSESFTVNGARLTVALQVQEATLLSFFERSGGLARGSGFLARFLVAWPESTQGFRPFVEAPELWPHVASFNKRIEEILDQPVAITDDGALSPALLQLAPGAKTAWITLHDAIERELRSGGELYDVRDIASKAADNAARLATLLHAFESGTDSAVAVEAVESASRIVAWHLNEARRFFGELALPPEVTNAARLDTWLLRHCRSERSCTVSTRTIQQYGPVGLRDKATIDATVRELIDLGRARLVQDGRRRSISVNPALLAVEPQS
ncbi:YfjI family protein [Paraburkholderia azotifigens]|uniref:YfjI family protein n=1 Tax=Paraburkholderia azotifigens TaxID=2057004 RepID=A0ABU9R4B5_9BURK